MASWVHLTHLLPISPSPVIRGNKSERSNWLLSVSPLSLLTALTCSGFHCLCIYSDGWRDCQRKRKVYFFPLPFFPCAISCLQKPLMPIQHQHQGTALMSILATDSFLSVLPAALSLSPSFPANPLYPFHFPPLTLYGYCTIK